MADWRKAADIAGSGWMWDKPASPGQFSNHTIQAAAASASFDLLKEILSELRQIRYALKSLGADGIHEVIREAKQQALLIRKQRLAKERRRKLRRAA